MSIIPQFLQRNRGEQIKPKVSIRKEIIKIRAEINKKESKKKKREREHQ